MIRCQQTLFKFNLKTYKPLRQISTKYKDKSFVRYLNPINVTIILGGAMYGYIQYQRKQYEETLKADALHDEFMRLSTREKMFLKYASVEYAGQIYMTPLDFLESIVDLESRPRNKRKILSKKWIVDMQDNTKEEENKGFLSRGKNGIISYIEYMFLLSLVSKPTLGFKIAFDMFDHNSSGSFTKEAFYHIEKIIRRVWKSRRLLKQKKQCTRSSHTKIYDDCTDEYNKLTVATTLHIILFGSDGNESLSFQTFAEFVMKLQMDVIEYEFKHVSHSGKYITAWDFAYILLRYSYRTDEALEAYQASFKADLQNMDVLIDLQDFKNFSLFVHSIEDFQLAMRFYNLSDVHISPEQIKRAASIAGDHDISADIIKIIYTIFDTDNDGYLSRAEFRHFIAVMKDRLYRGFRSYVKTGLRAFQSCIRDEMNHRKFK